VLRRWFFYAQFSLIYLVQMATICLIAAILIKELAPLADITIKLAVNAAKRTLSARNLFRRVHDFVDDRSEECRK